MKILPEYLEVLILGTEYNNNIILPNSLKFIFFGRNYSKQIPKLPNNLKNVCFEYLNDANQICNLPESLEYLSIGGCDGIILNKNKIKIPKQIKLFEYAEYNNEYEISESTKTRNLDYYHTRYWEEKKMKNLIIYYIIIYCLIIYILLQTLCIITYLPVLINIYIKQQ